MWVQGSLAVSVVVVVGTAAVVSVVAAVGTVAEAVSVVAVVGTVAVVSVAVEEIVVVWFAASAAV